MQSESGFQGALIWPKSDPIPTTTGERVREGSLGSLEFVLSRCYGPKNP